MYKNFTIQEAKNIGQYFEAICDSSYSYDNSLTIGRSYKIKMIGRILSCSPLCEFLGDDGKLHQAHVERFTKLKELNNETTNN